MQPDDKNQFDFILDPAQKKTAGPSFLLDPKKRIIFSMLFVVGFLLLLTIGFSVISSLNKKGNSALVDVYAYQTEIARITKLGLVSVAEPSLKIKTSTLSSFISSDLANTSTVIAKSGKKLTKLETDSKLDPKLVKNLESAKVSNTFDAELLDALEKTSASYKVALKKALDGAGSSSETTVLQTAANNILTYEKL